MLDSEGIDTALRSVADAFLGQLRQPSDEPERSLGARGWGQFLNRPGEDQVGLYGTCSGVIAIALTYGGHRVPMEALTFLCSRWRSRTR